MKVKDAGQREVDIFNVFVEVTRLDDTNCLEYWVTGVYYKGLFERQTILKFTFDVEEALDYCSDLKHQIAEETFKDSSLTCGV